MDLKNKKVQALVKADVDNNKNKDMKKVMVKKEMPKKEMGKKVTVKVDVKKAPSKKQEAFLKMIASKSKKK